VLLVACLTAALAFPNGHLSMRGGLPLTIFGVAMVLERNLEVAHAFQELGHEIACHCYRWINCQEVSAALGRQHMERAGEVFQNLYGAQPLGWLPWPLCHH
tara:strand:+ start:6717 stop:7019 length:303 start_codon:yes stop_codon:yes gene_type:complete